MIALPNGPTPDPDRDRQWAPDRERQEASGTTDVIKDSRDIRECAARRRRFVAIIVLVTPPNPVPEQGLASPVSDTLSVPLTLTPGTDTRDMTVSDH